MGWQQDLTHFQAYAKAITASAQLLLDADAASTSKRELASNRMLLQSFLKSVCFYVNAESARYSVCILATITRKNCCIGLISLLLNHMQVPEEFQECIVVPQVRKMLEAIQERALES